MNALRRLSRPLVYVALALASLCAGSLLAQQGPGAEEMQRRVEWLRQLAPEDRAKLKSALERFRALPSEERTKLREKATRVGAERLEGLAGRDLKKLHDAKSSLEAETDAVIAALGPGRIDDLPAAERAYLRAFAMRGFQRHMERRVLGLATVDEVEKMTRAEKRARVEASLRRLLDDRMNRLPDAERARIDALPPAERRQAQRQLLREFRMDETREYARVFDRFQVQPFLQLPPEKRAERVRRWQDQNRWTAVLKSVRDLGIGDEGRRALAALGPADWARVGMEASLSEALPPLERRTRIERMIQRLAAERASDGTRRADVPPLLRKLRERRLLQNPTTPAPADAPR